MVPLYAYNILPEDLSLLEILDPAEQFLFGLCNLGLVHGFLRFYSVDDDADRKRLVVSTIFWFLCGLSLVLIALLLFFQQILVDVLLPVHTLAGICFFLTVLSFGIRFLNTLSAGYLHTHNKAVQYSTAMIVGTLLFCLYNFYYIGLKGASIQRVFEARLFLLLPVLLFGIWSFRNKLQFRMDFSLLKKILVFSTPLVLTDASYPILTYIDRWMISVLDSASATGIYGISYRFGMIPGMLLVAPFIKAWRPFMYENKDRKTRHAVYHKMITYFSVISCVLWLGISVYSREMLVLFTTGAYVDGYIIIPYIALSQLMYGLGWIVIASLAVKNKTFFVGFFTFLGAVLNILLNLWWIPLFGFMGAAYSTVAAFAFIFVCYAFYSYTQEPIRWPILKILSMVGVTFAGYLLILNIDFESIWVTIIIKGVALLPVLFLIGKLGGINLLSMNITDLFKPSGTN